MISYLVGDATQPVGSGPRYIVHVCNNSGGWGAGFVLALSKRWPDPEFNYRAWYRGLHDRVTCKNPFRLGNVQPVQVEDDIWVINMIAQNGYGQKKGIPLRYDALEKCLAKVAEDARVAGASIHMPRIGCGLAGGKWEQVEEIIQRTMGDLDVFVYTFPV